MNYFFDTVTSNSLCKMRSFTLLFNVLTVAIVYISKVDSRKVKVDLDSIINSLRTQQLQEKLKEISVQEQSEKSDEENQVVTFDDGEEEEKEEDFNYLKHEDIVDFINKALQNKEDTTKQSELQPHKHREKSRNKQLTNKDKTKPKKPTRLPKPLLDSVTIDIDENEEKTDEVIDDLSGYSKIYLILHPKALKRAKNINSVSELVTKIMRSFKSDTNQNREKKKERRYKGFLVNDSRRRPPPSRGGREYSEEHRGSGEGHRPQRYQSRGENDDAPVGGRTPLPFLNSRGDIYAKDY